MNDLFLNKSAEPMQRFNKDIWTTVDGDQIPLTKLGDEHLLSVLEFCHKHSHLAAYGWGKQWIPKLEKEIKRREEM